MSRYVLLSIMLLAAGCSSWLHRDTPPVQTYILRAAASPPLVTGAAGAAETTGVAPVGRAIDTAASTPTLQLSRPSADPGLSTQLITLVRSDRRMDYYMGSQWAAELPEVVETLAIDTLRASGNWGAVHDSPSPYASDYTLQVTIRRFEADYTGGGEVPQVHVMLDCALARRIGRELVASFVVEGTAEATENRMGPVVAAFEKAANLALRDMAERSAAAVKTLAVTSNP
ncbi:MAG TPA: ABC-type transport auxiliary lipoprotein family protein [Steroidobacteraceae bacterium]|nr:ABC-type transport auxiliary lipoprotein family protein [Steroidobacteraceae bacterium]